MAIPLLFISDAPDGRSGLGRITRDLATLASRLPEFRVAVLGLNGRGSRQLPFVQYHIQWNAATGEGQWGEWSLPDVWADFAGRERGVVMTIWDASRLHWFARPERLQDERDVKLRTFLQAGHFARWGYFPIDSCGPGGKLTGLATDTIMGFDRVLCYTKWAEGLVRRSIGDAQSMARGLSWLPHGINTDVFCVRDRQAARAAWDARLHDDEVLIGTVATNQERKNWGLAAMTGRLLRDRYGKRLKLWWHVDVLERSHAFSIPALLNDYGLSDCTIVTHGGDDTEMAWRYAACDATMHFGPEGFGFSIAESLSCGIPVVHMNYAGGAEIVQRKDWLVEPLEYELRTLHNCLRPVFSPHAWVDALERALGTDADECRAQVAHLSWSSLWSGCWSKWLLAGVQG